MTRRLALFDDETDQACADAASRILDLEHEPVRAPGQVCFGDVDALLAYFGLRRDAAAANNLGLCRLQQGDAEAAHRWFSRALEIEPGFLPAEQNLRKMR